MKLTASLLGLDSRPKTAADLSKVAHLFEAGSIISDAAGDVFRVRAKVAGPEGFVFKLANLQGKPVQTPVDFYPLNRYNAKVAKWMRFVLAYNADWDMYVKEYIRAAGLPVDESYNWAKWFQAKFYTKLKGDDEVKDEAIHQTIVTALAQRKALDANNPAGFQHAIKRFPPGVQQLPLEKQVTQFLLTLFSGRVQEANQFIDKMQRPDSDSMTQDAPEEQEDQSTTNILDTEEHATGPEGQELADFKTDMNKFRQGFSSWLDQSNRPETAKNYLNLWDAFIYWVTQEHAEPKISDIYPFWAQLTRDAKHPKGLGFDSMKQYYGKFPQMVHQFTDENRDELEGNPLVAIVDRLPKKTFTQPAQASVLGGLKLADDCDLDALDTAGAEYVGDNAEVAKTSEAVVSKWDWACPSCQYGNTVINGLGGHVQCHKCNQIFSTNILKNDGVLKNMSLTASIQDDDGHETDISDEGYCTECGKEHPSIKDICSDCRAKGKKTADDVASDIAEAKTHTESPDSVDADIKQPTEPMEKQAAQDFQIGEEVQGRLGASTFLGTVENVEGGKVQIRNKNNPRLVRSFDVNDVTPLTIVHEENSQRVQRDDAEEAEKVRVVEDEIGKFKDRLTKRPSCWGCGGDWSQRWSAEDLAPVQMEGTRHLVCPDCVEDVGSENLEFVASVTSALKQSIVRNHNLLQHLANVCECGHGKTYHDGKNKQCHGGTKENPCNCDGRIRKPKTGGIGHEFTDGIRPQTNVQDTGRLEGDAGPNSPSERDPNWRVTGAVAIAPQPGVGGAAGLQPQQNPATNVNNRGVPDPSSNTPPGEEDKGIGQTVLPQQVNDETDSGSGQGDTNKPMKHTVPPDLPFQRLHLQSLKDASLHLAGADKAIVNKLRQSAIGDSVGWSGKYQEYVVKRQYFYTHGMTEDKLAEAVKALIPNATITSARNFWHPWPKDSWFEVRFKVPTTTEVPAASADDRAKAMGLPSAVPGAAGIDPQGNIIPADANTGTKVEEKSMATTGSKRATVVEKIKARKAATKWAKLRQVADEHAPEAAEALEQLGQAFGELADRVDAFRENLDLVDAPKNAALKTRIAARRALGANFKRIAEESPEIMAGAVNELFHSLDDVAGAVEAFAENMGIELTMTPVEKDFAEEGQEELAGDIPVEEIPMDEDPKEANSGGGARGWTNDRDENGQPKTPEKATIPVAQGLAPTTANKK